MISYSLIELYEAEPVLSIAVGNPGKDSTLKRILRAGRGFDLPSSVANLRVLRAHLIFRRIDVAADQALFQEEQTGLEAHGVLACSLDDGRVDGEPVDLQELKGNSVEAVDGRVVIELRRAQDLDEAFTEPLSLFLALQALVEFHEDFNHDLSGNRRVSSHNSHERLKHVLEVNLNIWEFSNSVGSIQVDLILPLLHLSVDEVLSVNFTDLLLPCKSGWHSGLMDIAKALALHLDGSVVVVVLLEELSELLVGFPLQGGRSDEVVAALRRVMASGTGALVFFIIFITRFFSDRKEHRLVSSLLLLGLRTSRLSTPPKGSVSFLTNSGIDLVE
eukprot:CAMPEP_0170511006 /NCGR_PEP_ID=MMETSP0208-20121228/66067_1 /TAXON_ID=197538 /ORGANISM="Strombidium inclinatum, Strain S3" /LENGTH=331 /DNA_ID=CAMNT_0010794507 /DNA_START=3985 /DNA_END=4980 /DNA_ORIENTATION=+